MAEMQFLLFFIFRPWPKHSFYHFHAFGRGRKHVFAVFLLVGHGRKPFFTVFSVSAAADEMQFINLGDYWAVHRGKP